MKYLCESYTDVGGRENNEDALLVYGSPNGILLVVADGLGGHDCGEVASGIAVETLKESFSLEAFDPVGAIRLANSRIMQRQAETGLSMKTTVSVAWIYGDTAHLCHVGDSRIYAFKDGAIRYQSIDHSASQMAVSVGEIPQSQIRNHPDRNKLTRALGVTDEVKVDVMLLKGEQYESLLLCTDGFWEYVLEAEMIRAEAESSEPALWLKKMLDILTPRASAGNDNNTAIVLMKEGDKG